MASYQKKIHENYYLDIGNSIEKGSAILRIKTNKDVFCASKPYAKNLAKSSYGNRKPVGPEIDKGKQDILGYYYHYHVFNRTYKSHAFFI